MENNTAITASKNKIRYQSINQYEVQEKIARSDNRKLIALIGHDIRTPMGSIISFLDLLTEGVTEWPRKKIKEHINIALLSAENTMTLLDSILKWALSENIKDSYHPAYFDLTEILNDEIQTLELFAAIKNIKVILPDYSNITVFADKNMVKSILRNLLSNAIKYSHWNGKIEIHVDEKSEFIETTIKDYGVGMKNELSSTLFNSNKSVSTPGTNSESGTAFGLALCKEFIDIHKGKIWIVRNAQEGSEFKFTLPWN